MQRLKSQSPHRLGALAAGSLLAAFASPGFAATVFLPAAGDAEIREQTPEQARGGTFYAGGAQNELAVRRGGTNNQLFLVKFDLAAAGITNSAQLENYADLRIFSKNSGLGGSNAQGLKIWGVNPTAQNASSWDETQVFYRDAGIHQNIDANNASLLTPSVIAQPANPAGPHVGAPALPIEPADNTYGASPSNPRNAPGLKFQYAPYSQAIVNANAAAKASNQTNYDNYQFDLADNGTADHSYVINNPGSDWVASYVAYQNQPGYTASTFSGTAADTPTTTNGPLPYDPTVPALQDMDPAQTSFLGYLDIDALSGRAAGFQFSFTQSPDVLMASKNGPNRSALVAFLANALDVDHATSVTFLVSGKMASPTGDDPLPARGDNLIFASKEWDPDGTGPLGAGVWAPQLVLAPEPGSLTLVGLACAGILARRRRN